MITRPVSPWSDVPQGPVCMGRGPSFVQQKQIKRSGAPARARAILGEVGLLLPRKREDKLPNCIKFHMFVLENLKTENS